MVVKAVDVSAWQGALSQEFWHYLKGQGVGLAIIQLYGGGPNGIGPNPHANKQLTEAQASGMDIAGYTLPASKYAEALAAAGDRRSDLLFCALDVESIGSLSPGVKREYVDAVEKEMACMIYASRYTWSVYGSGDFSDVALWDASYYGSYGPDNFPTSLGFTGYGGWTERVGWQFRGDATWGGSGIDLNIFDEGWLNAVAGLNEDQVRAIAAEEVQKYNDSHYKDPHNALTWAAEFGEFLLTLNASQQTKAKAFLKRLVEKRLSGYTIPWKKPTTGTISPSAEEDDS